MWRRISNQPRVARRFGLLVLLQAALLVGGCGPAILSVDDAIVSQKGEARLVARLERAAILALREDVEDVRVRFYADGREVGDDETDEEGTASEKCKLDAPLPATFEARSMVDGMALRAFGRVFFWDDERVIIAVDIDGTISKTDYKELILENEDEESDPIRRSRSVLRRLAETYRIVYVTARPRSLLDKTRQWLVDEEFPEGPVITAPGLRQSIRQVTFKRDQLRRLQKDWPTLLIGIGNEPTDAKAYGASDMLTLIVGDSKKASECGAHAIALRDWKAVDRFFEANAETLTDRDALRAVIRGKGLLLRPVPRYQDDD